jgi:rubrerythrin
MKKTERISDLFALAITAENAAMNFYRGLSLIFSHVSPASLFWEDMMNDEALHARELRNIRERLTEDQLNMPADRTLIMKAEKELEVFSGKFNLSAISTLDDAYEIAYDLEYSEVNAVFQAIVGEFVSAEVRLRYVTQVREHVAKIEDFPKTVVDLERMRKIPADHHHHA